MSGRARRKAIATRTKASNLATRPPRNGNGTTRQGTPSSSQRSATGPALLKPQTSTAACSRSTRCLARMSDCRSAPPSSKLKNTKTMRRPLRVESEETANGGSFFGKCGSHLLQNAAGSRIPKPVRVEDRPIVDRDTQLAETAANGFDLHTVFRFQLCRHPGSNCFLRESEWTTADNYLSHNAILTPAAPTAQLARKHVRTASCRPMPTVRRRRQATYQ
jgi:hypothetical protein